MERTVGESVDQGDVQTLGVEKRVELLEPISRQQLARFTSREAEAKTERRLGREPGFQWRRIPA